MNDVRFCAFGSPRDKALIKIRVWDKKLIEFWACIRHNKKQNVKNALKM
jgi:hypothetical protein